MSIEKKTHYIICFEERVNVDTIIIFLNKQTLQIEKYYVSDDSGKVYVRIIYDYHKRPIYLKKHMHDVYEGKTERKEIRLQWQGDRIVEYNDESGNWWREDIMECENPYIQTQYYLTAIYEMLLNNAPTDDLICDKMEWEYHVGRNLRQSQHWDRGPYKALPGT